MRRDRMGQAANRPHLLEVQTNGRGGPPGGAVRKKDDDRVECVHCGRLLVKVEEKQVVIVCHRCGKKLILDITPDGLKKNPLTFDL